LWRHGLLSWHDWPTGSAPVCVNPPRRTGKRQADRRLPITLSTTHRRDAETLLRRSQEALAATDAGFFAALLKPHECWRLFFDFRQQAAYLDIETSGLGEDAEISVITLYDGLTARRYVNGDNLDDFARDVARYALLVSYGGRRFDIPFLERALSIRLPQAQIDLCPVLHSLGYRGGLKKTERALGIVRDSLQGVDGLTAAHLWRRYRE
jgi:uncharacterized protein YprB with RNaseH-like and TPR domain